MPDEFRSLQDIDVVGVLAAPLARPGQRQIDLFSERADQPTSRAGVPTIIDQSFELLVKVDPAARNVPTPQVRSGTTVEFAPSVVPVFTRVFLKTACRLTAALGKEM